MATAQEYDAKTLLLQSQMDYSQALRRVQSRMGLTPEARCVHAVLASESWSWAPPKRLPALTIHSFS